MRGRFVRVSGDRSPRVRGALDATDWAATPVVDAVSSAPTTRGFEGDHQRTGGYRHDDPPPLARHDTGERAFRVERVTGPLYERLGWARSRRLERWRQPGIGQGAATASSTSSRGTGEIRSSPSLAYCTWRSP